MTIRKVYFIKVLMLQSFIFDIVWNKNELRSASRAAESTPRHHIFLIKYDKPLQVKIPLKSKFSIWLASLQNCRTNYLCQPNHNRCPCSLRSEEFAT
jgi:hypothetical protein